MLEAGANRLTEDNSARKPWQLAQGEVRKLLSLTGLEQVSTPTSAKKKKKKKKKEEEEEEEEEEEKNRKEEKGKGKKNYVMVIEKGGKN